MAFRSLKRTEESHTPVATGYENSKKIKTKTSKIMTKKEYLQPAVRIRHIMYEAALCNESLPKDEEETIGGEGAWGKEQNLEEEDLGYQPYSVWED